MRYQVNSHNACVGFFKTLVRLDIYKRGMISDIDAINENSRKYGVKTVTVTFMGHKPSTKSPDCSAFHLSTKSRKRIEEWLDQMPGHIDYVPKFINCTNYADCNISAKQLAGLNHMMHARLHSNIVIGLGNFAQDFLDIICKEHFKMPHPSGLCRFWNDEREASRKLTEMIRYIEYQRVQVLENMVKWGM